MSLQPGTRLGPYEVTALIGSGGYLLLLPVLVYGPFYQRISPNTFWGAYDLEAIS